MLSTVTAPQLVIREAPAAPGAFGHYLPGDTLEVQTARLLDKLESVPTLQARLTTCQERNRALAGHNSILLIERAALRETITDLQALVAELQDQLAQGQGAE